MTEPTNPRGETFEHLCTVLMIMWGDMREIEQREVNGDKEWEQRLKEARAKHKEAMDYLESWIDELKPLKEQTN